MSGEPQAEAIDNNENLVKRGHGLILHRQRAQAEPSTSDAGGADVRALRRELKSVAQVLLRLEQSVDALAEDLREECPMSDFLGLIPAGRHRLLAQIMMIAYMTMDYEGDNFVVDTDKFVEQLEDDGLFVEAGDHQFLIRAPVRLDDEAV